MRGDGRLAFAFLLHDQGSSACCFSTGFDDFPRLGLPGLAQEKRGARPELNRGPADLQSPALNHWAVHLARFELATVSVLG